MIQLIGKFHLLVLHLPIGILLLAVIFEWLRYLKLKNIERPVLTLIYGIGAICSILTITTGYILSVNGDYATNATSQHLWAGIITGILSILSWYLSLRHKSIMPWLSIFLGISIAITGHLGGSLTHGSGFLNPKSEAIIKQPIFNIQNINQAVVFEDLMLPIIQARCISCHGTSKQKGKLRLDDIEQWKKGGKSGKSLLSSDLKNNEFIHRITLPTTEKKHMPPKEKTQLKSQEIEIFEWWIKQGAPTDSHIADLNIDSEIELLIQSLITASEDEDVKVFPAFLPDIELPSLLQSDLNQLKSLNIVTLRTGELSDFLELNFLNVDSITFAHWQALDRVSKHVIRLKLSDLNVNEADTDHINNCQNLIRLYLDNTHITDQALAGLQDLDHLRYLNLNGTSVTDDGIQALTKLPSLHTIYAFDTDVTRDSVSNAQIVRGDYNLPFFKSDTAIVK